MSIFNVIRYYYAHRKAKMHENRRGFSSGMEFAQKIHMRRVKRAES